VHSRLAVRWFHQLRQPHIEGKRPWTGNDPIPPPVRMTGIHHDVVLTGRHGAGHQQSGTSLVIAPRIAHSLSGRTGIFRVPALRRLGCDLNSGLGNTQNVQNMRLQGIEALVMHQPLEDRERKTLGRVVKMSTSRMPVALSGESARAAQRALRISAKSTQSDSPTSHDVA
jgi:hypothetical protein